MTEKFDTGPSASFDAVAYMKRQFGKFEGYRDDEPRPKQRQSLTVRVGEKVDPLSSKEVAGVRERFQTQIERLEGQLAYERRRNALLVIRTTDSWQDDHLQAELKWRDNEIDTLKHEVAILRRKLDNLSVLLNTPQGRTKLIREAAENLVRVLAGWYTGEDFQVVYDQLSAALEGGDDEQK